jgi:uncharacterized protein DUF932
MHAGMALADLGNLIVKQHADKRDFLAPTSRLALVAQGRRAPALNFALGSEAITADLTPLAFGQIATWAGIPKKYADVMAGAPENRELLERNVNHWLTQRNDTRLVRSFVNGESAIARAFLSDRYRTLDHYDLAHAIMPMLTSNGMTVKSAAVTDTRLYLQAIDTKLSAKIQPSVHQREKDDTVYAGVVISNSEVGEGSLSIEPMVYRLVCTNGLIAGTSFRRYHIGRSARNGGTHDPFEVFTDDTKRLTDAALWAQVKDVVNAALSEASFQALVAKLQGATIVELPQDPTHIVEVTAKRWDLTEDERDGVMRHLFAEGDLTLYGLTNAVTRTAQDATSYDRAVELERIGSDVLTADPNVFAKN